MKTNGEAIVLFDGVCNFCNGSVNFIIERDRRNFFKFAPLQSAIGQKLLREYQMDAANIDSVIYIENGAAYTHSTAALKIAEQLGGAWKLLKVFSFVPKKARDFFYKLFAKNRYRLFGKTDACLLPTADVRARFLG